MDKLVARKRMTDHRTTFHACYDSLYTLDKSQYNRIRVEGKRYKFTGDRFLTK